MMLREYLDARGIKHGFLADKLDITRMCLSRLMRPGSNPPLNVICGVEIFTNGKIKYKDWVENYQKGMPEQTIKENIA